MIDLTFANMELHTCGFNSHKQLLPKSANEDLLGFCQNFKGNYVRVLGSFWSSTVLQTEDRILHLGCRPSGSCKPCYILGLDASKIVSLFGDTSGALGAITTEGSLYGVEEGQEGERGLEFVKVEAASSVKHLAIQENGQVCVCSKSAPILHTKRHQSDPTQHLKTPMVDSGHAKQPTRTSFLKATHKTTRNYMSLLHFKVSRIKTSLSGRFAFLAE